MTFKNRAYNAIAAFLPNNWVVSEYHKRGTSEKKAAWNRQATTLSAKEIKDWKKGITEATDPENPRRGTLMRFYQNMWTDLHLGSCVDNRILPVQCAPYKLVDAQENEDREAKKLLERPWYINLVKLVCMHTYEGTKLIELFELNEKLELKEVTEIPQSNFLPDKGIIIQNEYDDNGTPYKEGVYKNYYIQVGGDWEMGLFSQLAIIIIAKKLGLGSWMSYIDRYGVPPIFAITDRMDTNRRDELFEMLENFRQNHFAVLQGSEKIETPKGYNVDAHNTFKSLMDDVCNKEISKRIQGGTGTSDEKSYVGSAEVHERLLKYRHMVDKLLFKYYFNEEIKPRLVSLSPVYKAFENLTFEWDETETLTMNELMEVIKELSAYYEFNVEELVKITGLPITGRKGVFHTEEKDGEADSQKKKNNRSGITGVYNLYAATWDSAIKKLANQIFDGDLKPEELDKELVLKTYDTLAKEAEKGYGKGFYEDDISRKIRENLLQFSGAKTNRILQQIAELKQEKKSREEFLQEAAKISERQTGQYLEAEATYAARACQSAKDWQRFEKEKKILPNLTFHTMKDGDVRPKHAVLEGMTKPVESLVWKKYTPPLGPGCRCWLEQTTSPETTGVPNEETNPQYGGCVGKTGKPFTDQHSYFQLEKHTKSVVRNNTEALKEYLPYNNKIELNNNKTVYINDFADPSDLEQNIRAAKKIASVLEKDIYIRPHVNIDGRKNPELGIGKAQEKGDLKTLTEGKNIQHFVKNALKSANKQGCKTAVLDISTADKNYIIPLKRKLYGEVNKTNKNIQKVVIIRGKKVVGITRKQIEKLDFKTLESL